MVVIREPIVLAVQRCGTRVVVVVMVVVVMVVVVVAGRVAGVIVVMVEIRCGRCCCRGGRRCRSRRSH
jgi:hypothetical protein